MMTQGSNIVVDTGKAVVNIGKVIVDIDAIDIGNILGYLGQPCRSCSWARIMAEDDCRFIQFCLPDFVIDMRCIWVHNYIRRKSKAGAYNRSRIIGLKLKNDFVVSPRLVLPQLQL